MIDTGDDVILVDAGLPKETPGPVWDGEAHTYLGRWIEDYFVLDEGTGKYICSICGYVYDPAEHDGVAFEDLPEDWKCPRCKQSKEKFNKA